MNYAGTPLVAVGRSSPETAARLFISAETASVYMWNILAEVGVASRGETAAAARRLGLFDVAGVPWPISPARSRPTCTVTGPGTWLPIRGPRRGPVRGRTTRR